MGPGSTSAWVGINSSLENDSHGGHLLGPATQKALEICGTEGLGCQVMVGGKGMRVTTRKCTIFSVTAKEEAMEEDDASR